MEEKELYRGYRIVGDGVYSMFLIKPRAQGDIPAVLEGVFTKRSLAQQAVDTYLNSLSKRGRPKSNAEEHSTSSS